LDHWVSTKPTKIELQNQTIMSTSSPSSSSRRLHVFLLLDPNIVDEAQRTSLTAELRALGVDDAISQCQVHVRSIHVPLDRLLPQHLETEPSLVVVWGGKTCPTALYLKDHAACPVITIMDDEKDAAAAALVIAKFVSLYSPHIVGIRVRRRVESIRQAALVEDSKIKVEMYLPTIAACYDQQRQITGDAIVVERPNDGVGEPPAPACCQRFRGKVRDRWESLSSLPASHKKNNVVVMVTTDRQSGFDRQLAVVPFKGSVLNLCSQFWFNATADIIPNHLLSVPHPALAICRKCKPFPIEFVVRYVSGVVSDDTNYYFTRRRSSSSSSDVARANQQLVHDRLDRHVYLEALPERGAYLLRPRVARGYDQEPKVANGSVNAHHQGRRT
jgi:hypothetical protein